MRYQALLAKLLDIGFAVDNEDTDFTNVYSRTLFNENLVDLLAGKEVELPTYNFKTGKREYNGETLKLGEQDVLVIEGIHCLNDALTYQLAKENKFKTLISSVTSFFNKFKSNKINVVKFASIGNKTSNSTCCNTSWV